MTMGVRATIVPTEVPAETDKNDAIRNTPKGIYCAEKYCDPKKTTASMLPVALDTAEKAPARR